MFKMRHIFGFSRNARIHFQNAREGVPNAPFSRNCARSGSTAQDLPNHGCCDARINFAASTKTLPIWESAHLTLHFFKKRRIKRFKKTLHNRQTAVLHAFFATTSSPKCRRRSISSFSSQFLAACREKQEQTLFKKVCGGN